MEGAASEENRQLFSGFVREIVGISQNVRNEIASPTEEKQYQLIIKLIKTFNLLKEKPSLTFNNILDEKKSDTQNNETKAKRVTQFGDGFDVNQDDDNNQSDSDNKGNDSDCLLDSDEEEENLSDTEDVNKMKNMAKNLYRLNADDKIIISVKNSKGKETITKIVDHVKITDTIKTEKKKLDDETNKKQSEEQKKMQDEETKKKLRADSDVKLPNISEIEQLIRDTTNSMDQSNKTIDDIISATQNRQVNMVENQNQCI